MKKVGMLKQGFKSLVIGALVIGANCFAADFTYTYAKYKVADKGCEKLSPLEVKNIHEDVTMNQTRIFLNSVAFMDTNNQENFIFLFTNGYSVSGLPKYLTTFTTLNGCQMFLNNPEKFIPYLMPRQ